MFHNEEAIPSTMNEISKHESSLAKREYRWRFDFVTREEIIPLANSANIAGEWILFCQRNNSRWRTARTLLAISEYVAGEGTKFCRQKECCWQTLRKSLAIGKFIAGEESIFRRQKECRWWRIILSLANENVAGE
jgi:hypothetical protein